MLYLFTEFCKNNFVCQKCETLPHNCTYSMDLSHIYDPKLYFKHNPACLKKNTIQLTHLNFCRRKWRYR